ncbi:major facilitator superfamily domain-containing protein [Chytriomyces sp. MP71]|nr:major facilitator superfamily domain-containing protein [Chytriomyces sp. MP71]
MGRKRTTWTHWLLLALASVLMAGNYYCYDMPASMGRTLQDWLESEDEIFQWQLNSLYSASSLPNIIFPLIGGLLVDKLGPATILLSFSVLVVLGQTLFAVGIHLKHFPLLVVGRLLFGLGGESLEIVVARVLTDWFAHGGGLAFALGCNLASARVLTALNDNASPWIAETRGVVTAAWVGVVVAGCSFLGGCAMVWVDRNASRLRAGVVVNAGRMVVEEEGRPLLAGEGEGSHGHAEEYVCEIFESGGSEGVIDTSRTGLKVVIQDAGYESEEYDEVDEKAVHWSEAFTDLGAGFYLLCAVTIALYGATIPFFHISTSFFAEKWKLAPSTAGFVMSVPDWIAAAGSPIVGTTLDRIGHRGTSLLIASFILMSGHATLQFTSFYPTYGMVLIGVGFSIFSTTLWSCVPLVVSERNIATGFGLLTVALNVSLFTFPLLVAQIRNASTDFSTVEFTFLTLCLVGAWFSWRVCTTQPSLNRVASTNASQLPTTDVEGYRRVQMSPMSAGSASAFDADDEDDGEGDAKLVVARCVGVIGTIVATSPTIVHHHHTKSFGASSGSPVPRSAHGPADCSCGCVYGGTGHGGRAVSPVRRRIHYFGSVVVGENV